MSPCRQLIESVEIAAAQKQERLESELHSHKTNLIKESIRLGHNDLGDFFYNRGDLQVTAMMLADRCSVEAVSTRLHPGLAAVAAVVGSSSVLSSRHDMWVCCPLVCSSLEVLFCTLRSMR